MLTHTNIINLLAEKFGYESYLEIGVQNPDNNFNKIICKTKTGVEPAFQNEFSKKIVWGTKIVIGTSDQFFRDNEKQFDLIFIDGLHESEQVLKDIDNSLQCLTDMGCIVVHDCNPTTKEMQQVPRIQDEWTGDVWRAFVNLRQRPDLMMFTIDADYGCGIIFKMEQEPMVIAEKISYENFAQNRKQWLNLKSPEEFFQFLDESP